MAADTLSLRERIGRTLENAWGWFSLLPPHIAYPKLEAVICADLEPWVEQEIQQEREKAQARPDLTHDVSMELAAKDWARDDNLWTTQETVQSSLICFGRYLLAKQSSALAEKDAQIAALQAKIDDAEGPWWVSELANEGYEAKREVERQQAAMQQFSEWLTVRDNMWMERAHNNRHGEGDVCDEHHVELVDVRAEFDDVLNRLRETPAPPQEKG